VDDGAVCAGDFNVPDEVADLCEDGQLGAGECGEHDERGGSLAVGATGKGGARSETLESSRLSTWPERDTDTATDERTSCGVGPGLVIWRQGRRARRGWAA
jgi:hypothetical protein